MNHKSNSDKNRKPYENKDTKYDEEPSKDSFKGKRENKKRKRDYDNKDHELDRWN